MSVNKNGYNSNKSTELFKNYKEIISKTIVNIIQFIISVPEIIFIEENIVKILEIIQITHTYKHGWVGIQTRICSLRVAHPAREHTRGREGSGSMFRWTQA